jgi:misacylated tRNA(Ala) deacylase
MICDMMTGDEAIRDAAPLYAQTEALFLEDSYLREAYCHVSGYTPEGGILVDRSVFYATAGGQPGDCGWISWKGGRLAIATAVKVEGGRIALVPAAPQAMPAIGAELYQRIDWERRYRHMRLHTALHLLSAVIPLPVIGGQVGTGHARLDFHMPEAPSDMAALERALNGFIEADLPVTSRWIDAAELLASPAFVKTMSVRPPPGLARVRLICIARAQAGADPAQDRRLDRQACGGTHVARTGEIGRIAIDKIENRGRQIRRVGLALL